MKFEEPERLQKQEAETQTFFNAETLSRFESMRSEIHEKMEKDVERRKKERPAPSETELSIGAYYEEIEPQVRDAVFELNKRGYSTESSGLGGQHGEIQQIDGYFEVDGETKRNVEALGVNIETALRKDAPRDDIKYTRIFFFPPVPNLDDIRATWQNVAELMPHREVPASPSIRADTFLKETAPERTDIEKAILTRKLELLDMDPALANEIRERIREIDEY